MITAYHHFELNGVKYRAAESVDGGHYTKLREPLRLQTAAVVQGESGKFQIRPDILEWRLSDWSGGEGLLVHNEQEANRYHISHNVDPLDEAGKLKLAKGYVETDNASDVTLPRSLQLAKGLDGLWGAATDANFIFEWDEVNERWSSGIANGNAGFGGAAWQEKAIVGDNENLYIKEKGVAAIWSYDGSTFTEFSDMPGQTNRILIGLESNLYYASRGTLAGIHEIVKSDTPPTTPTHLLDLSASGVQFLNNIMVSGTNRVYFAQVNTDRSIIWRITPSTAAVAGFGEEILRQGGLRIETLWFHMGVLFMAGRIGLTGDNREAVIMYLRGAEVGVLANLRPGVETNGQITATESQEFERAYFLAKYGPGDGTAEWTLFAVELVSGAVAGLTVIDVGDTAAQPQTLVSHNGEQFFGTDFGNTTNERTIRVLTNGDTFVDTSAVTAQLDTAINDFAVVDEKILLSLRLMTEPLSANSSVELQYQIDQDGTWVSAGTHSTTGSTGTFFTISTSGSVVPFRNLQLRLILKNAGTVAESPVVRAVTARATVALGIDLWDLALDLADDAGEAGTERTSGTDKIANIIDSAEKDTVVQFLDGYRDRRTGEFTTHQAIIDDYRIVGDRPGEGTAYVRLREVS